jgi:pimeloyl-ACP methyl ester carboxylesterase
MIYWATESIGTSFLPYYDHANASPLTWTLEGIKDWTGSSKVPAAFALFPKDISHPPREWAERFFNVQRWTEMPRGGHFAAMEQPELLMVPTAKVIRIPNANHYVFKSNELEVLKDLDEWVDGLK